MYIALWNTLAKLPRILIFQKSSLHSGRVMLKQRAFLILEPDPQKNTDELNSENTFVKLHFPVLTNKFVPEPSAWSVGPSKVFSFQRRGSETLEHMYQRVSSNLDQSFSKKFEKLAKKDKTRQRLRVLGVSIEHDKNTLPDSTTMWKLVQEFNTAKRGSLLLNLTMLAEEINPEGSVNVAETFSSPYILQVNPARIKSFSVQMIPMTGCPVMPELEAKDFSYANSQFEWYVSNETVDEVESKNQLTWPLGPTFEGLVFYPSEEAHLGRYLRLHIRPCNEFGEHGLPYRKPQDTNVIDEAYDENHADYFEYAEPIQKGPSREYFKQRVEKLNSTSADRDSNSNLRLMSYNILADMYSRTPEAANLIFTHCPVRYLDYRYRLPLILQELEHYKPDIVCLQEVDRHVFKQYLVPFARNRLGMRGELCLKRLITYEKEDKNEERSEPAVHPAVAKPAISKCHLDQEKGEGVSIFFKSDRFECLKIDMVHSLYARAAQLTQKHDLENLLPMEIHPKIAETPDFKRLAELVDQCQEIAEQNDEKSYIMRFREKAKSHSMCSLLLRDKENPARLFAFGCSHLFFHAEADFWRLLQTISAKLSLYQLALTSEARDGVSVFFCADMNSDPPSMAVNSLLNPGGGLELTSAYPIDKALLKSDTSDLNVKEGFTNWVGSFCCMIDYIIYGHVGGAESKSKPIECHCLAELPNKMSISKECLKTDTNGETDHTLPSIPHDLDTENIYALPNAHFPSDHVSLVADFKFPPAVEQKKP